MLDKNPLLNPEVNSKTGPRTASFIIVFVLVVGALFVFYGQFKKSLDIKEELENQTENSTDSTTTPAVAPAQNLEPSTSTEIRDLEEDLESPDFESLESSVRSIDSN